ncbi:MAG: TAXI family TRAP transporter solute-binding subunit [Deinococcota bacterium]|jgi:TRAP transporter TAXI family solute receptor|nr:TAXI family TRAP transporter solute-binding subunit [Deinococcota bacterium]
MAVGRFNSRLTALRTACLLCLTFTLYTFTPVAQAEQELIAIGGGLVGGTFNAFATGISDYLRNEFPQYNVIVESSSGSAENIRQLQGGELEMAIAFAGDAYLAANQRETFDDQVYDKIRAVGFLYGAVSQLVVLESSEIRTWGELAGRRIALGAAGSGTHLSIERLLRHTGLLDSITPVLVGGQASSDALKDGQVSAYHALLGVPNATVTDTSTTADIVILSTYAVAQASGFFEEFPFYEHAVIPAGTYRGVDENIDTWQDAGIWVVSADLSDEVVYEMTRAVYSQAGLDYLQRVTEAARDMNRANAMSGIVIPLHPGAARFWQEAGVALPNAGR